MINTITILADAIELIQGVKKLRDKADNMERELGEARATMLLNYGEKGVIKPGLCAASESLVAMITKVCKDHYEEEIKKHIFITKV